MAANKRDSNNRNGPPGKEYLTRAEAVKMLGVRPQTLYAYVSRGLVHSVPQPDGRSSFYLRQDVERIHARSAARAGLGAAAASAMRWGEPIVTTSITRISDVGPSYRNRPATDLVRAHASFETVADLLWEGTWVDRPQGWSVPEIPPELMANLSGNGRSRSQLHIVHRFILATGLLGAHHSSIHTSMQSEITQILLARQAIRMMAGVFGFLGPRRRFDAVRSGESIATGVARVLGIEPTAAAVNAINALLVLDVDHELTSSTFVARIAASTGANLHFCIGAALNTHQHTGSYADSVEELLDADPRASIAQMKDILVKAQRVPGFNHPLYPTGDPRAAILLEIARDIGHSRRNVRTLFETVELAKNRLSLHPSFEIGSVILCRSLGLPAQTSTGLRFLARTAGWVAHIFEQRLAAFMIRPRAKYIGTANT